jgi:peptide deformylase
MKFPIVVYGDPILRKKADPINPDFPDLTGFLESFWETMYYADGVGLAAPQIGLSIRLFVIDASAGANEDPSLKDFKKVFINPEICDFSGQILQMEEGCLSLPEIKETIARPDIIRIKYLDENFQEHDDTFKGFVARIVQHEYDHLEGKLTIDHLSPLRRKLLRGKLLNITKGKISTHYQIRLPI